MNPRTRNTDCYTGRLTLVALFSVRRPCWMTSASRRSFLYAFSITCKRKRKWT